MQTFNVEKFKYNGFCVNPPEGGWGQIAEYIAEFIEWTNDPGIAKCICSDGQERLIPSCCLKGDKSALPKSKEEMVYFGIPSES